MANADFIKERVKEYYTENPIGATAADAFAPWWLTKRFSLSPADANRQCADAPGEMGLDGFYLDLEERPPVLCLVQAKLTDNRAHIKSSLAGFTKVIEELSAILKGRAEERPAQNNVFTRLVTSLEKHEDRLRNLRIELAVIHLCRDPREVLLQAFSSTLENLARLGRKLLPNHRLTISLLGPDDLQPELSATHTPAAEQVLLFDGTKLATESGMAYYVGFGRLADLVRLYEAYGDQLFAKNVRAFLYKALQQGPAFHMRQTLGAICDKRVPKPKRLEPSTFAVFHNGVTLHAVSAEIRGGKITIREPNILNGCQTVKNAFLYQAKLERNLDPNAWEEIVVPLRVLVTGEEELIRSVTVSNNRQNSIRASAFRANDPLQLELSERLRVMGIFYERQEGAFENLRRSSPKRLEEEYRHSVEAPLTMEELAQVIATVSNQPALSVAAKISDLFEEMQYRRVFSAGHLRDLELLVFLRNLFRVTGLAIRDLRGEIQKLGELRPDSFKFPAVRVLARYVIKTSPDLIEKFGRKVDGRIGSAHPLRAEVLRMMRSGNSGFQQILHEVWFDTSQQRWKSATDKDCVESALRKVRLSDFNVFEHRRG